MTDGAAAAAAIANAIKASGVVVKVENRDFLSIVQRSEKPLVVVSEKSFWRQAINILPAIRGWRFILNRAIRCIYPGILNSWPVKLSISRHRDGYDCAL